MKNRANCREVVELLKLKHEDESDKNASRLSSLKNIETLKQANKNHLVKSTSQNKIDSILCKMGQRPNPLYFVLPESPEKTVVNSPLYPPTSINSPSTRSIRIKKKLTLDLKNIESIEQLKSYYSSVTSRVKNSEESRFDDKRVEPGSRVKSNAIIKKFMEGGFTGLNRESSQRNYSNLVRKKPLIIRHKKNQSDKVR